MNIGDPSYWDLRYDNDMYKSASFELFDWYCPFDAVFPIIENVCELSTVSKVLIIGVGKCEISYF